MKKIFILVGFSGSGKTSLVNSLDCDNLEIISAGKIFSNIAQSHSISTSRIDIQDFAISYFKNKGYDFFIDLIVSEINNSVHSVLIEGLRHYKVINKLKEIFDNIKIIFINVEKEIRKNRLIERDNYTIIQVEKLQNHSIEKELINVKNKSNYIVHNNTSFQIALKKIRRIICN